jgi:large subunit ribosomal protein L25
MENITLVVTTRKEVGKAAAHTARRAGLVPGVLYGHSREATPLTVPMTELRQLLRDGHEGAILSLMLDGGKKPIPAIIKDVVRHAVSGVFQCVDFQAISMTERIEVHVPIKVEGEAPGVKVGGVFNLAFHELPIICTPSNVPDHIVIDISKAEIGDILRASELELPKELSLGHHLHADEVIFSIKAPHGEAVEEVIVEEPAKDEPELIRKPKEETEEKK